MFKRPIAIFNVIVLSVMLLNPVRVKADDVPPGKAGHAVSKQEAPVVETSNAYLKVNAGSKGGFTIGTTGGDPATTADDNKLLLFGFPSSIWSSYTTLRVDDGSTITDTILNASDIGSVTPTTSPYLNGSTILTIWNISGITVEQRLTLVPNPATGRNDICAINYVIKNLTGSTKKAGIRIMLDVMIGTNDGAPYFIDGAGYLTNEIEFNGTGVPSNWVAYESSTFDENSLKGYGIIQGNGASVPNRMVIARWPYIYGTTWDYAVNSTAAVTSDSAVGLYYNPSTLGNGETRSLTTYYGIKTAGQPTELNFEGFEVTQGIQDLNNSVPLIQDRPTVVRAHVSSTAGNVANVTAQLTGTDGNGNALPESPLQPSNRNNKITVYQTPKRENLNDSFYFDLPATWLKGTVNLQFDGVNHTFLCLDRNRTDCNKRQVSFSSAPELEIQLVGILYTKNNVVFRPDETDMDHVKQEIKATFPIPNLDSKYKNDIQPVFLDDMPTNGLQFARLDLMLEIYRALDGCLLGCKRYYMGVLDDAPLHSFQGTLTIGRAGGIPSNVAAAYEVWGLYNPDIGIYNPAHELGHDLKRHHTDYNAQRGITPIESGTYPHTPADGTLSEQKDGSNAYFGFDVFAKHVYPASTADLMSYGNPKFTSKFTWDQLKAEIAARYTPSAGAQMLVESGTPAVLISGTVDNSTGTGVLWPVINLPSPGSITAPDPGDFTLRIEDSAGTALASYSFQPEFGVDGTTVNGSFSLLLPSASGAARYILLHGSTELYRLSQSAHAPTVTLTSPNGGEFLPATGTFNAAWTANDLDGNALEYTLQFSPDNGTTWQTLAYGLTATSYDVDLTKLPGTSQGLMRVFASDGFSSAQDQSNATFSVAQKAPQVTITGPDENAFFVQNQTILLTGEGYDQEDGILSGASLQWSSNLNGFLGTGTSLAINAANLAEGTHIITLTATDSSLLSRSITRTIQVFRNPQTLPAHLSATPDSLEFIALVGSNQPTDYQTLSIRNLGDGVVIWNAVKDQSWINLSANTGSSPVELLVQANPTGLASGDYVGNITLTATNGDQNTQVITVTLHVHHPPVRRIYLPQVIRDSTPFSNQTLTINKNGTGSGTVTSNPSGINCGSTCSYAFAYGTSVTLTAAPASPSTFGGWSGSGCTGTGTCTVTMNSAKSVTATFNSSSTQVISVITPAPASAAFLSSFTVNAISSSGLPVAYSSTGVCVNLGATFTMTSGTGICTVHFNQAGNANYLPAPEVTEAVSATKLGQMITFTSIAPINAVVGGPTYAPTATGGASGNPVTFMIDSSAVSVCSINLGMVSFTGVGTCIINANQVGNANYNPAPQVQQSFPVDTASQTLLVSKSGSGSGTVTSDPGGINCGSTCFYSFAYNTVVTLTATPTSPSTFGGWSGSGCSGTGTCTVTMNAVKSVVATFNYPASCLVAPTMISPVDGSILNTLIPLFEWNYGNDPYATLFWLQVSTDPGFSQIADWMYTSPQQGTGQVRFWSNLNPGTTYYWRTFLKCGENLQSPYSATWFFTTGTGGTILPAPSLISPVNGSILTGTSTTLQWSPVSNAVEYQVFWRVLGTSGGYVQTTGSTQSVPYSLSGSTTYEWYSAARNNYAWSDDSVHWTFTTGTGVPSSVPDHAIYIFDKEGELTILNGK